MPVIPELRGLLLGAIDVTREGQDRVVTLSRNNRHRTIVAILKRAGIEPFRRPFQTLRQSCETELAQRFPQHVVSAWMGHSEKVSVDHYLMITTETWERAAGLSSSPDGQPMHRLGERAAKSAAVGSRTNSHSVATIAHGAPDTDTQTLRGKGFGPEMRLGRGGLEPPTHGFSVRCSTS